MEGLETGKVESAPLVVSLMLCAGSLPCEGNVMEWVPIVAPSLRCLLDTSSTMIPNSRIWYVESKVCGEEALKIRCLALSMITFPSWLIALRTADTIGKPNFLAACSSKPVTLANFTPGPDRGDKGNHVCPPTCESASPSGIHKSCMMN